MFSIEKFLIIYFVATERFLFKICYISDPITETECIPLSLNVSFFELRRPTLHRNFIHLSVCNTNVFNYVYQETDNKFNSTMHYSIKEK